MIVSANVTPIPWVLKGVVALKMLDATYIVSIESPGQGTSIPAFITLFTGNFGPPEQSTTLTDSAMFRGIQAAGCCRSAGRVSSLGWTS